MMAGHEREKEAREKLNEPSTRAAHRTGKRKSERRRARTHIYISGTGVQSETEGRARGFGLPGISFNKRAIGRSPSGAANISINGV